MNIFFKIKYIVCLVVIAISTCLVSFQPRDEYSDFINEIKSDFIPEDFKFFFLVDSAYAFDCDLAFEPKTKDSISKIDANFSKLSAEDFLNDTTIINWRLHHINSARFISKDSIEYYYSNTRMISFIKQKFYELHKDSINSKKQFNKIFIPRKRPVFTKKRNKLLNIYSDSLERSIPKEQSKIYTFYKPIFSQDKQYAFFWVGIQDSSTNLYLYKKANQKWKQISHIFSFQ